MALCDDGRDLLLLGDAAHHGGAEHLDALLLVPLQAVQETGQGIGVISAEKWNMHVCNLGL